MAVSMLLDGNTKQRAKKTHESSRNYRSKAAGFLVGAHGHPRIKRKRSSTPEAHRTQGGCKDRSDSGQRIEWRGLRPSYCEKVASGASHQEVRAAGGQNRHKPQRGSVQRDGIRNSLQIRRRPTKSRAFCPHSRYNPFRYTARIPCRAARATAAFAQGLDARIPAAQLDAYREIRDARRWRNPWLVFRPSGIEVVSTAIPDGRIIVPVEQLRAVLVELPISTWPYGRVVAGSDIGIIGDPEPIRQNREAAEAILDALDI